MELMLKKMRADFDVVARARKESGEWSDADIAEFSAVIKLCVQNKDHTGLSLWARWLADLAAGVVFFSLVVRGTEAGMRAMASEAKVGKAGQ